MENIVEEFNDFEMRVDSTTYLPACKKSVFACTPTVRGATLESGVSTRGNLAEILKK